MLFWFIYNYFIGCYEEEVIVCGLYNILKDIIIIVVIEGVVNVIWIMFKFVVINVIYIIIIYFYKGYNVIYVVDFGVGKSNIM